MENLEAYKKQLEELKSLVDKLENGDLTVNDLVELEHITREMHEKSIILKYKAFERHVKGEVVEEDAAEVEEVSTEEENTEIEFAIFDEADAKEEEEVETPVFEPFAAEPEISIEDKTEEKEQVLPPVVEKEEVIEEIEEEKVEESVTVNSSDQSFWEKLNIEDNSLGSQFGNAKIDTLIGAFGLNQKLRYINDLFDGSSELFSDAVKLLDTQSDLGAAQVKVGELAAEHAWDPEEESVAEFVSFVNRRYA